MKYLVSIKHKGPVGPYTNEFLIQYLIENYQVSPVDMIERIENTYCCKASKCKGCPYGGTSRRMCGLVGIIGQKTDIRYERMLGSSEKWRSMVKNFAEGLDSLRKGCTRLENGGADCRRCALKSFNCFSLCDRY